MLENENGWCIGFAILAMDPGFSGEKDHCNKKLTVPMEDVLYDKRLLSNNFIL